MAIKVYNTATRSKETLESIHSNRIGMYVCGVTVYDMCHIGHARAYVAFDVIQRYLRYRGYELTYVRNFTDVDDKIINRAHVLDMTPSEVAEKYIDEFNADAESLCLEKPDVEPRVTRHIPQIIEAIQRIVDNGHAYIIGGDVYFSIDSFPEYGKLSQRNLDEMIAGGSDRITVDERKRNPLDFALWKSSKEGEPAWDSPWGKGRPGWHIECSVMSTLYLGKTFDIHGGGKDLIFPHHENELAQAVAANKAPFVHYWLHNGFVTVDEEKMSKSLGNFFTVRDVLEQYHPQVLRYFLLTTHYRSPINYSDKNLIDASRRVEYLFETLKSVDDYLIRRPPDMGKDFPAPFVDGLIPAFHEAMDDDFNTAQTLAALSEPMRQANELVKQKNQTAPVILKKLRDHILVISRVLGVFEMNPDDYLRNNRERSLKRIGMKMEEIDAAIKERKEARNAKDFAKADQIRLTLQEKGVILMDSPEGTNWKVTI